MKVHGFDVNIGVEGVFVEENRASSVVSHVEPTSKNVMVDILRCFLQGDDVPPACNLLFEGTFFSTWGPWVPIVDTQALLHGQTIFFVGAVCYEKMYHYLAKICDSFLNIHHMMYQGIVRVCFYPPR